MRAPWRLGLLPLALQLALVASEDLDYEEEEALIDEDLMEDEQKMLREFEDISSSSADVKQCLWYAMQEYNLESNDTHTFLVSKVLTASLQITALKEYTITVEISRSTCRKPSKIDDVCVEQSDPDLQKKEHCTFMVGALPWRGEFVVLEKQCKAA